jgi:hypothetical protein
MHDCEVFLQAAEQCEGDCAERCTRSPVQDQEDRVSAIFTAHGYPLLNAADFDEAALIDSLRRPDSESLFVSSLESEAREKREHENRKESQGRGFHGTQTRLERIAHSIRLCVSIL